MFDLETDKITLARHSASWSVVDLAYHASLEPRVIYAAGEFSTPHRGLISPNFLQHPSSIMS